MTAITDKRRKAAALAYKGIGAPTVVAKAEDDYAEVLIDAARASDIPVLYDARLVDYLDGVDVGQEIPETLLESVAIILSWAYWLRGRTPDSAGEPRQDE
jgi:flagellar biosynthesis protein